MQDKHLDLLSAIQDVYEKVSFYGVYVKYGYCVKKLMSLLKLEDPAELHYVMMHLARLSCIVDSKGSYLWASQRYNDLHDCTELSALAARANAGLFNHEARSQLNALHSAVFLLSEMASTLIYAPTANNLHFNSHVKAYPIYDEAGHVVAALNIFTEIASRQYSKPAASDYQESIPSGALLATA